MGKGLAIAGLVTSIVATICSGVAQYLPHWQKIDAGLITGKSGVWRVHVDGADDVDWIDNLDGDTDKRNGRIIRYAILGGGVFLVFSIILISAFIGTAKRALAVVASIFSLVSVGAHTASVVLYHVKFEPEGDSEYSYSFYLAIGAAALSLVSGILKIAAAVTAGTKVEDDFGRSTRGQTKRGSNNKGKGGKGNTTTRSFNSAPKKNAVGSYSNRMGYGGQQSYGGGQRGRR